MEPGADVGQALGQGLTAIAAAELGLNSGTAVAAGLIDAHAGGIGTVGIGAGPKANLAYVFGTSSCTMTSTAEPAFVEGVWGPYYSAMVPGLWLNEGGQSAAGAAIEQLLSIHPAFKDAMNLSRLEGVPLPVWLADMALKRSTDASQAVRLAVGLHVVPEFLGNRAPFADPSARAVIAGIGMGSDIDSLLALYVAGLCGIGYGLRQIIDAQVKAGVKIETIVISGGAGKHDFVRQMLADASGKPVVATKAEEPVLLGAAALGAVAGGLFDRVDDAMADLSTVERTFHPCEGTIADAHQKRYDGFKALQLTARTLQKC